MYEKLAENVKENANKTPEWSNDSRPVDIVVKQVNLVRFGKKYPL